MEFQFSAVGERMARGSGIGELMEDLGQALAAGDEVVMLGGGQPATIPAMEAVWGERIEAIAADPEARRRMVSTYEEPAGGEGFRGAVAGLLQREFGWEVGAENIAITSGGQTAFFYLFNLLAGSMPDGSQRKILLPLVPEYIGYSDQGMGGSCFSACQPMLEEIGERQFKYRINFDALEAMDSSEIGAVCATRPTNPSGNLLTDNEVAKLRAFAAARDVPLILDNAYGAPFPGILFKEVKPVWDRSMILTMSLSKIGLPGTRTGIVVAAPEIASALASMTAITGLANNNVGQAIVRPLLESGEILKLSEQVVQPFYAEKSQRAQALAKELLPAELPWRMHVSEGALFLWFWFEGLPISSKELYARLKKRRVLVIPGEYFFFGLDEEDADWPHREECIRVSYAMPEKAVQEGLQAIGEEVAHAFANS